MTPIEIKIEQAAQFYNATRGNTNVNTQFEWDTYVTKWQHPVDAIIRVSQEKENPIQIFTDGSMSERVGSGEPMKKSGEIIDTIQCRLSKKCTNNQAEQLALLIAMKHIEKTQTKCKRVTIYTDSQATLDKLQNSNVHTHSGIHKENNEDEGKRMEDNIRWVKAHAGIRGMKQLTHWQKGRQQIRTYQRVTTKFLKVKKMNDEKSRRSVKKWQRNWKQTTKGRTTKEYFPDVAERIKIKLQLTQNFTAILSAHGKTREYIHRFNR